MHVAQPRNSADIDFHEKTIYKLKAFYTVPFNNTYVILQKMNQYLAFSNISF